MIAAVFDSNVLASGFVRPSSTPGLLLRLWTAGAFELVVAEPILDEVGRTLRKPYFARTLSPARRSEIRALLAERARISSITVDVRGVATHPEDDLVLAVALSAKVDFLVTGDRRFREHVPSYQGVTLITPREFLELLERPTVLDSQ